jgi:hypothetical protein
VVIRRDRPDDFDPVNDLWRRSRLAAFPDSQARTGYTDRPLRRQPPSGVGAGRRVPLATVNYLGHAAVATWRTDDRAFVLGAMLPDFATMIGARPPATTHPGIGAGMRFHYRTDEVFHRSAEFLDLTRSAFAWLLARGVERGRARAVAHVGVELLLDTCLVRDESVRRTYVAAIESSAPGALGRHVSWASGPDHVDFGALRERLLRRGLAADEPDATVVAQRLRRTLQARRRLALDDASELVARDWLITAGPLVEARASALARELASQLL